MSLDANDQEHALRARQKAIATAWQRAVAHTSYAPYSSRDLRRRFNALAGQALDVFSADTFDVAAAQAIGETLVSLRYAHPEALARTHEVLGRHLMEGGSASGEPGQRLVALLSALSAGFVSRARQLILEEQEAISLAAINARKEAEQALRESEARFFAIFQEAAIGMGIGDMDGRILAVNRALQTMFGYSDSEFRAMRVMDFTHPEDARIDWELYEELVAGKRDHFRIEKRYFRKNGQIVWTHLTVSLVRDTDGQPQFQVAMMEDITTRKALEARLAQMAFFDALTGLPNRTLFLDRLGARVARSEHSDDVFALLFLDLDGFKVINDSLGHDVGDRLLAAVARRLETCVSADDTVARLGGNEFTILLDRVDGEARAVEVAQRITAAFALPYTISEHQIVISASIGVVVKPPCPVSATDLLRQADITMYRAKEQGKGRHAVFHPSLNMRAVARFTIETELRRAIDEGQFELHYQPIVSLADARLTSLEALVRWRHPARGLLLPEKFIPVAEETGLIIPMGHWILTEACLQTRRWQERYPETPLAISVNLSALQLRSQRLTVEIADVLTRSGLSPSHLQLELTESMALDALDSTLALLNALTDLGVHLAIDDFGTGHSSLSHLRVLKHLPVRTLKIDRAFVTGLAESADDQAIMRTIIQLARTLGLAVIAEGVETAAQGNLLRAMGCDGAQGWHFGAPVPASAMDMVFSRREGARASPVSDI